MELPTLSTQAVGRYLHQCKAIISDFFAPLDEEAFNYFYLDNQRFTMPIERIQEVLNDHYVNLNSIEIVYSLDDTSCQSMTAKVLSPFTYDHGVTLFDLTSKQTVQLPAHSILKVNAE
ncbi:hypothetical protein [Dolosicoccus paucivorans]|uniref:Uncharacterized protein n=1 Tax=Dolosicoccus paucivorans TaxID=84521 RepID=A0A2N6SMR9_9LACT|nr:hypothetical protein [Dolosicoccus paucivorans]PMC58378.1 hypothetical protein CJ205_04460 [Dolosicoccus paucivorans]